VFKEKVIRSNQRGGKKGSRKPNIYREAVFGVVPSIKTVEGKDLRYDEELPKGGEAPTHCEVRKS